MTGTQILTVGIAIVVPVSTLIASYFVGSKVVDQMSKRVDVSYEALNKRIDGVGNQLADLRADMREIRNDIKLLTGKVYELLGEKH